MPAVLGTYYPRPEFTFPRSYVYQMDIALYGTTLEDLGHIKIIHATPPVTTFLYMKFRAEWYDWNSSIFRIDTLVQEFYAQTPPSPTQTPIPFDFGYWINTTTKKPGLFLNWFTGTRLPIIVNLPSQPSDYWVPRILP